MNANLFAIPRFGFGCMRLPLLDPKDQKSIDMPQFKQMVDAFLEAGGTYFDTAYVYHEGASETALREALVGADVFLGVSTAGVLDADMVRSMAGNPLVMALANPDPEISYDEAKAARPDVIVATGRTDYPNQVNNVLGFPYIFRGALDVRARKINEAMKLAAAHALAELAREEVPAELAAAFGVDRLEFGPDYLIPKLTDPRLLGRVAPAVARAAVESGVAQRRPDIE